jgi:adenylate cyclase
VGAPDFAALGLLEGLDPAARAGRLALLDLLYEDGCPLDELVRATLEGRLALLPAEHALGGAGGATVREIAAEAGVDADALRAARRAAGLPLPDDDDAPELGEPDRAAAHALAAFLRGGFPLDDLVEASRVFGGAAGRAAAAAQTVAATALPRRGDTELDLALRMRDAVRDFVPRAAALLGVFYVLHRRETLRAELADAEDVSAGRLPDVHDLTVGFCDLVGYTRLGEGVPAGALGAVATRLAVLAADAARPPVRLVKTLGDAAMLVAPEPGPLVLATLEIIAAAHAQGTGFPPVHAGVSHGPVLRRWGDWYGGTVNLAARLAERAAPGTVLADARVHERAAQPGIAWSAAGVAELKGVRDPVEVFVARRAGG